MIRGLYLVIRNSLNEPRIKILKARKVWNEICKGAQEVAASGLWQVGLPVEGLKKWSKAKEHEMRIHKIEKEIRWLSI